MSLPEACVSQYSLTVDAADTIDALVQSADTPWGRRLGDALVQATTGRGTTFAVAPYRAVSDTDFDPAGTENAGPPEVGDRSVDRVLMNLAAAGLISARTVLNESPSETYLSDGRIITAVEVHKPFVLVTVEYSWSPGARNRSVCGWNTTVYADRWQVTERSYIVPAGWYLVAEVGELTYDLVGVAGVAGDSDDTVCWLFDLEGFGASRCVAGCDSCGARWSADSGSWRFEPDDSDAPMWRFDDADDCDDVTNTVTCPSCDGRVGFMIF